MVLASGDPTGEPLSVRPTVKPFGILLTGGSSRRMGRDKATIEVGGVTLAERSAAILQSATALAVEVGPGASGLPHVTEEPAGSGPLAAVLSGYASLVEQAGSTRPAIVLACDMPEVTVELLTWLANYCEAPGDPPPSVVPIAGGKPQPLCARWSVADLSRAAELLEAGERSLKNAFGPDALFVEPQVWEEVAPPRAFDDLDTPADLADRALAPPIAGDDWVALTRLPLGTEIPSRWATLGSCGAVVTFAGTVRDHSGERAGVEELTYEAYEEPAMAAMARIVEQCRTRWKEIGRIAVHHRLGKLEVGEIAVVVAVSAGHRPEAFSAAAYLIDTVKESVPIWKLEKWAGGEDWGLCH